ncbi:hypothetical protein G9A89_005824 [Geosiphon pyriformis]|nr:hypothetical protein G9A89_005824 [Geosiphon pyriformis]
MIIFTRFRSCFVVLLLTTSFSLIRKAGGLPIQNLDSDVVNSKPQYGDGDNLGQPIDNFQPTNSDDLSQISAIALSPTSSLTPTPLYSSSSSSSSSLEENSQLISNLPQQKNQIENSGQLMADNQLSLSKLRPQIFDPEFLLIQEALAREKLQYLQRKPSEYLQRKPLQSQDSNVIKNEDMGILGIPLFRDLFYWPVQWGPRPISPS